MAGKEGMMSLSHPFNPIRVPKMNEMIALDLLNYAISDDLHNTDYFNNAIKIHQENRRRIA
jgi:hypothetical protein